jgi:photosystem II stability/assembly factor-like uncharacterized protein
MGYRGILLLACFFAGSASAATSNWSIAGPLPSGGFVGKVVVNPATPSILYAAAQRGVYKSTDSGGTWTRVFETLNPPTDIAIDPQSPGTLYVVSDDDEGKIYKSIDSGATWEQIDNGILGKGSFVIDELVHVAVDPVDEGVVYVGGNNTGVYKSTDGGAHWTQANSGIVTASVVYAQVIRLVVDPVSPTVLYAMVSTSDGSAAATNLYRSTDSGATWTQRLNLGSAAFGDLAIDPADHTHLVTCFSNGTSQSTDSGATWQPMFTATLTYMETCAFDPSDSSHILVGSYTSLYASSGGGTFSPDPSVPPNGVGGIAFDPVTPSNIYLGSTAWGVLKSVDGGSTWSQSTTGIPNLAEDHLLEGADGILYMSTAQSGIFKSLDQGATWAVAGTGIAGSLPTAADAVDSFAQDPTAPAKLYVGSGVGLYRSSDSGNSWAASDTGMPVGASVRALAVDTEVPATVYAGLSWFASGSQAGVYKSVDRGATWAAASSGITFPVISLVNVIVVDPHNSSVVYAAPYQNGLFKSVNAGASWAESDTGMGKKDVFSLAVDPANSSVVYVSAVEGFYKSSDGGATWAASGTGISGNQISDVLLIDPVDPSILYLSTPYWGGGAYVSKSGAASWQALNSGVLASASVTLTATLIDPVNHAHIYSTGSDGEFYVQGAPATAIAGAATVGTTPDTSVEGTLSASPAYGIQTLSFSIVQPPAHGQVDLDAATGKFTYAPAADYLGADGLTFQVTDQWGGVSNVATESLVIADVAPRANAGTIGTSLNIAGQGMLSATPAYAGQTLSFSVVTQPAHGAVSISAGTGQFKYIPSGIFAGTDEFTFKVTDAYGTASNTATEQITITEPAPIVTGGGVNTTPNTAVSGTLSAMRGYAGQRFSFNAVSAPTHGTTSIDPANGQFTYRPAFGYTGTDSFTFDVTDSLGISSNVATETVTVIDAAPTAHDSRISSVISLSEMGDLICTRAYQGQTLTYVIVSQPTHGTVKLTNSQAGVYIYMPTRGYKGQDSFTFKAADKFGVASNVATVSITDH